MQALELLRGEPPLDPDAVNEAETVTTASPVASKQLSKQAAHASSPLGVGDLKCFLAEA